MEIAMSDNTTPCQATTRVPHRDGLVQCGLPYGHGTTDTDRRITHVANLGAGFAWPDRG